MVAPQKNFTNIYLHIGFHKTATSSIQKCLHENRIALEEKYEYFYPEWKKGKKAHGESIFAMFNESHAGLLKYNMVYRKGGNFEEFKKSCFEMYSSELNNTHAKNLIISGEHISKLDKPGIINLKNYFSSFSNNIYIVVWVREPVAWATSMSQQLIKRGLATLEELESDAQPKTEYRQVIESFANAFGSNNLIVTSFNDAQSHEDGVVGRFCNDVGIPSDFCKMNSASVENKSMSQEATLLLSSLNNLKPSIINDKHNQMRMPGDMKPFEEIAGGKFKLSLKSRKKINNEFQEDRNWLLKNHNITFAPGDLSEDLTDLPSLKKDTSKSIVDIIHTLFSAERKTTLYRRAEINFFNTNYNKAKHLLSKSLEYGQADSHDYRLLSQVEYASGNYDQSLISIEAALNETPKNKNLLALRNLILKELE